MGKATLSLSTNVFPDDDLIGCLEWSAHLGLSGVEVGPRHGVQLYEDKAKLAEAKAAFDRLGTRPLSAHSFKSATVEQLEMACNFAKELGAGLIVVHCRHEAIVEDLDNQAAMLRKWDDWCRERNIILTVENSSRQPVEDMVRLCEAVPGLRMTLDVRHACKPETMGMTHLDFLKVLGDKPANFHIAGINRAREELGDGTPPGDDLISWDRLASDLVGLDYSGIVTIELILPRHMTVAEQEKAYYDLPPATEKMPTIGHRLAAFGVKFFSEKLAPALGG